MVFHKYLNQLILEYTIDYFDHAPCHSLHGIVIIKSHK